MLVFGPGSTNADGVVAAGYVRERLPSRERPDERVGVTGIPFPADRAYWMTGTGRVSWCAGSPPGSAAVTVGRAREALDLLESDRVLEIVDGYLAAAPCIEEPLDASSLAELYLLRGLAHHVEGRAGSARDDFAAASGIHPDLRWDVGYPPDPQQVYLVAREEALAAEPAHFFADLTHVSMKPLAWWQDQFTRAGFEICALELPLGEFRNHQIVASPRGKYANMPADTLQRRCQARMGIAQQHTRAEHWDAARRVLEGTIAFLDHVEADGGNTTGWKSRVY
ncbi:MAG: hypothetical protein QGH45_25495, partial [Myxococcota bacterium]|nr:hypothetical protein [Myxococcota bacterium]